MTYARAYATFRIFSALFNLERYARAILKVCMNECIKILIQLFCQLFHQMYFSMNDAMLR